MNSRGVGLSVCHLVVCFSPSPQAHHAVSRFSTPRTLERSCSTVQLLPESLGHQLISRASTRDCHCLTPHWTFSLIWKHLDFPAVHIWMRHSCWRISPSKGKSEMLGGSQSTMQIQSPTITISPTMVGSFMAGRFQLFPM